MSAVPLGDPIVGLLHELHLDPGTARWSRATGQAGDGWLVLPSPERPQLLVPCVPAAAALVANRLAVGAGARARRRVAVTAVRSGAAGVLPLRRLHVADPRLADLRSWLSPGHGATALGVLLGPPRANRKPVLVLLGYDGRPICYAKVGGTPASRALVRGEADRLRQVAALDLQGIRAPRVLRQGRWNDLDLLATSPLAGPTSRRHPADLPVAATRELMARFGRADLPLVACSVLAPPAVRGRPTRALVRLGAQRARLVLAVGVRRVPVGAAHGDWTPWNMAVGADGVLEAWDWERFDPAAPQGLDVVHFALSAVAPHDPRERTAAVVAGLPDLLAACGVDPALTRLLLCTYLVHVSHRYAHDLDTQPSAAVERRLHWVGHLLDQQLDQLDHEEIR